MAGDGSTRRRRESCWWEPTYQPDLVGKMAKGAWDFAHNRGPTTCLFSSDDFNEHIKLRGSRIIKGVTFTDCDFQGFFQHSAQIVFDDCKFVNCDFGLSTWTNVKFSVCQFDRISFGQTKFVNSEFRSCTWQEVGISPNAFEIESTYFSNCGAFISAASTNLDEEVLKSNNATALNQTTKLESTKATVARRILKMLQSEGDEHAFYDAVKTFQIQHAKSGQAELKLKIHDEKGWKNCAINSLSFIGWHAEEIVLRIFGFFNNWGESVTKPIFYALLQMIIFSILYCFLFKYGTMHSIQRSFDISILAGYSIHVVNNNRLLIFTQNIQIIFSVILYAICFATIINRLSRVR